tara:strand:+ start:936 stop:1583 length:648 start_codon:yes stop_codon:yes gene_type:complete
MKIIKILGIRYKLTIVVLVISITGFVVGCGSSEREMLGDDDYEFTFVADAGSTPTVAVSDVPFEEPTVEPTVEPTEEPVIEEVNLEFGETVIAAEGERLTEVPLLVPVSLRIGQKLSSPSLLSGLGIEFLEVIEDTRCPENTECSTVGRATVSVKVGGHRSSLGSTTLTLEDGQVGPSIKKLGKYSAVFISLEPFPVEGEDIDLDDYVGTFAVID